MSSHSYIPEGGVWTAAERKLATSDPGLNAVGRAWPAVANSISKADSTVSALVAALDDAIRVIYSAACTCATTEQHNNNHNDGDCGAVTATVKTRQLLDAMKGEK